MDNVTDERLATSTEEIIDRIDERFMSLAEQVGGRHRRGDGLWARLSAGTQYKALLVILVATSAGTGALATEMIRAWL
jgi:hypothetical protein